MAHMYSGSPNQVSVTLATSCIGLTYAVQAVAQSRESLLSIAAVSVRLNAMAVDARDGDLEPRECCECYRLAYRSLHVLESKNGT